MKWVLNFAKSTIGAKFIMAITGFALIGFVIAHMVGNLQIFLGQELEHAATEEAIEAVEEGQPQVPARVDTGAEDEIQLIPAQEALNAYGVFLKEDLGGLLWLMRLGLLLAFILHIAAALRVWGRNKAARPKDYRVKHDQKATFAGRYMMMSGLVVLFFVIFHLAHYTWGWVYTDFYMLRDPLGRHDVYNMTVLSFQNGLMSGFYIVAQAFLALHLGHAASSMLQTLGIFHRKYNPIIRAVGAVVGVTIFIGNTSIPLFILLGIIKPTADVVG